MLLKDFYTINTIDKKDDSNFVVTINVNENHDVFKGHFPGNPVMPGVCMMQIIKELTEQITKSTLLLKTLTNVKFMALINPFVTPELRLNLEISATDDNFVKVKNTTFFNETVALKLSGVYKKTDI